jgi:transcriptional antiterminator RfaH
MPSKEDLKWYAVRTKSREEERASTNLAAAGIETFLPLLKPHGSFTAKPFFPGYIFARFDLQQGLRHVSFSRGVSYVVKFGDQACPIPPLVIDSMREKVDQHGWVHLHDDLRRGDRVVVHSGPMHDLVGTFEQHLPASGRVRVLLTALAFTAHVEVASDEIRRSGAAA